MTTTTLQRRTALLRLNAEINAAVQKVIESGAYIMGPKGMLEMQNGVIRAARHVHMSPDDAKFHGVKHLDKIGLRVIAPGCTTVFDDLIVRVDPTFKLEVHIDTDEANACDLDRAVKVELISR
jgi:propanediol utilization protein